MYKLINKKTKAVHLLNNEQYRKFFELKRATKQRKVSYEHIGDKYYSYDVSWFANNYEDYDIINLKDEMYNDIVNIALAVATVTVVVAITKIVMYYV
tara:strand:+ start:7481 stop:7771 length:291 start_codon:yes stop_codon:yes gene_type:complete